MSGRGLSAETIHRILSLCSDSKALKNISLVSREFQHSCQSILFEKVVLDPGRKPKLIAFLGSARRIITYIRELDVVLTRAYPRATVRPLTPAVKDSFIKFFDLLLGVDGKPSLLKAFSLAFGTQTDELPREVVDGTMEWLVTPVSNLIQRSKCLRVLHLGQVPRLDLLLELCPASLRCLEIIVPCTEAIAIEDGKVSSPETEVPEKPTVVLESLSILAPRPGSCNPDEHDETPDTLDTYKALKDTVGYITVKTEKATFDLAHLKKLALSVCLTSPDETSNEAKFGHVVDVLALCKDTLEDFELNFSAPPTARHPPNALQGVLYTLPKLRHFHLNYTGFVQPEYGRPQVPTTSWLHTLLTGGANDHPPNSNTTGHPLEKLTISIDCPSEKYMLDDFSESFKTPDLDALLSNTLLFPTFRSLEFTLDLHFTWPEWAVSNETRWKRMTLFNIRLVEDPGEAKAFVKMGFPGLVEEGKVFVTWEGEMGFTSEYEYGAMGRRQLKNATISSGDVGLGEDEGEGEGDDPYRDDYYRDDDDPYRG
ncbi:hypothetical protein CC1G_05467 [Coprinopsis cinerea okayama7|uniref:Uncharacterized protein n=1 Tax=Coprinopsis cinerea (strain Okayama-7 / 130 / ATCC MYA-4618 / FGSC 9003) TaxID=240176 RepID=A8P5D3_COPC7|nr:hypothetical protein CC1G_05467 [Coprinopsis cinerea okayama7\|eukprot:XP_001838914.2 hypothetical protein CC1G_05467 [Coprinopsis cinerea okayama7\